MCDLNEKKIERAQEGDVELQYGLACEYENKQDYKSALKWYMMTTKYPFAWAEYKVGELFIDPTYNSIRLPDYFQAHEWFRKAADHGCKRAKQRLVDLQISNVVLNHCMVDLSVVDRFCNGSPSSQDDSSISHVVDSLDTQNPHEINYLKGEWHRLHHNNKTAETYYRRAAESTPNSPHAGALNRLGEMAERENDVKTAMNYYKRAIHLDNHPSAHNNLGILYESQGKISRALKHFHQAAQQQYACAYSNIARIHDALIGEDDAQFETKVVEPYKKAVSLNHALSGWALGDIYQSQNNMDLAFQWWYKAACLGNQNAQKEISRLYRTGISHVLPRDLQEHLNWSFISTFEEPRP